VRNILYVIRLRPSSRRLQAILGDQEFDQLQDMWADGVKQYRWSVAFPIIESFALAPPRYADEVLSPDAMTRLFAHHRCLPRLRATTEPHYTWVAIQTMQAETVAAK
jgi:hypothetical protein